MTHSAKMKLYIAFSLIFIIKANPTTTAKPAYIPSTRAVWPLDPQSQAKDVSGHGNNGKPFDIKYGSGPTGYLMTATAFLGKERSFAEMMSSKGSLDVGTGDLTFQAYIYFEHVDNGTIMVWDGAQSSTKSRSEFNGVRMFVDENDLHLDIFTRHATYGQLEKSYTYMRISPQQWLYVGFAYNTKVGVLRTWVNEWQRWEKVGKFEMETGGNLFLGGYPTKDGVLKHIPLTGRMSCAMVFAENLNRSVAAHQMATCLKTYPKKNTSTYRVKEALANWPLDKNHLTTDSSAFGVHGIPWGLSESTGPSDRTYGALFFKGFKSSNITVPNKFGMLDTGSDVSVIGYLYPLEKKDGVVLGWLGDEKSNSSLRIEIIKGILRVRLRQKTGEHIYPPLNCTEAKSKATACTKLHVILQSWQFIGVTYKHVMGTMEVWINQNSLSFAVGKDSVKNVGKFFMGGQPSNGPSLPPLQFRLSCVSIYGVSLERKEADHHVEACLRSWNLHEELTNPIAFWPFDEVHGAYDRGSYHLNGNIHGLSLANGPSGKPLHSYEFQGNTNSYIEIDNKADILDFQRGVTVSAFIYQDKVRDGVIFEWAGDNDLSTGVQFKILDGAVAVNLVTRETGAVLDSFKGREIHSKQWDYVGFSYTSVRGEIKLWLNEWRPTVKVPGKHLIETRGNVFIGGRPDERYSQPFKGRIACVTVFEDSLGFSDIMHAMATCTGRLLFFYNPVGLWTLSSIHKGYDLGGYGNNGQVENTVYADGPNGANGTAMQFKGHADSGVVVPASPVLDTKYGASFVAWVYMERTDKRNEVVFAWTGKKGASQGIVIGINENKAPFADVYRQRYEVLVLPPFGQKLEPKKWYMIGFSYNFYTGLFYLWAWDAKNEANGAESFIGRVIIETRGDVLIGTKPAKGKYQSFQGRISCVMLFNKPMHLQKLVAAGKECKVNLLASTKGTNITPGRTIPTDHQRHLSSVIVPTVILIILGCVVVFALVFYKKRQTRLEYRARYRTVRNAAGEGEQAALL